MTTDLAVLVKFDVCSSSALALFCRFLRHQDLRKQEVASQFFKKVQEAYQVLSDSRLRAVYDRGGRRRLEDDKAVIARTAFPIELLEEYEKLKGLWEERTYIQEVNPRGLFQMNLDATPLINGFSSPWSVVSLKSIYSQQSADANLTDTTEANITSTVMAINRQGLAGGIQLAVRQMLDSTNWVRGMVMAGSRPSLGVQFYRSLSDRMYLTSENMLQITPYGLMVSLNGQLSRRLDSQSMATLRIKESGDTVGLSLTHQVNPMLSLEGDVQVGYSSSHVRLSTKYQPKDDYWLNGGVKLSTGGPSFFYGVDNQIAKMTHIGAVVNVSTSNGVSVKLKLVRATMSYVLKVHLSPMVTVPAVLYATLLPLLLYGCIRGLAMAPLLHQQRLREVAKKREEREKEMKERRREAEAAVQLMQETVERVTAMESTRGGLVVMEAWYGCLFGTQTSSDPFTPPKVIDVRIPLQCLVADSKLILHDSAKSMIPGFFDPCIGERKHLRVRYEFRGMLHEVTVENSEPLFIPRESHRIVVHP